jgi:hypothetical protein
MNPRVLVRVGLLLLGTPSFGQVFKLQGGTSSLFQADGGSVEINAPNFSSSVGVGVMNGRFGLGAALRTRYQGYSIIAGDSSVGFELPTDVFDSSHYFLGRGLGVSRQYESGSFYAFAGATSSTFGTPFFLTGRADEPLGILFFQKRLSEKLRLVSRNVASSRQTSIQSLEYQPARWIKSSISGGIGSNQGYFAAALTAEREKFSLRTAYIAAGTNFQRIRASIPQSSELEKENVAFTWRPVKFFSTSTSHERILQPEFQGAPAARAAVDEVLSNFNVAHIGFGAGIVDSRSRINNTLGLTFYGSRKLTNRIDLTGNFYRSRPKDMKTSNTISGTLREGISQRLALSETIVHSDGQTTVGYGGEFASNLLYVRLDYQTVYLPLRFDRPFQQAVNLNARVQITPTLAISAASYVAPDGHVRYTFSFTSFLYRAGGMGGAGPVQRYSFPKYTVQGAVEDEHGVPLEGAALHINGVVAYTDAEGRFLVRLSKRGPHKFQVALDEFITPGTFEVVTAPAAVSAAPEDTPAEIKIILRRVPFKPISAPR